MKVKKTSRKLIKPQTPTPQNLKNYYISFLDQQQPPVNQGVILFYQPFPKPENDVVQQLQESLAKTLAQFYPLAGRYIKNDHLIDCSDQGAEFVEAEALGVELTELVAKTQSAEQLKDLFPDQYFRPDEAASSPLLMIQATHFPCGGLATSISVSHRVFDVSSLQTFISMWSLSNACSDETAGRTLLFAPSFDLPSLLPYEDTDEVVAEWSDNKNVLKRFVFNNVALRGLKSRAIGPVSRARAVCAVVAKALIGLDCAKHGRIRDFCIFQPVNMRERTIPPQPKHACGNLSVASLTPRVAAAAAASAAGVEDLGRLMGDAVRKCIADHAGILSPDGDGRGIIAKSLGKLGEAFEDEEMNVILFSDCSKFGFYEADFGWGRPVWTATGRQGLRSNSVVLMGDEEGGGIEAWVYLEQDDMRCFEQDHEIKLFTNLATSKY